MNVVKADTIARTTFLVLALVNQMLAIAGKGTIDIAESDIYQVCTLMATIVAAVCGWWKNNSFTKNAIKADETLKQLKEEK